MENRNRWLSAGALILVVGCGGGDDGPKAKGAAKVVAGAAVPGAPFRPQASVLAADGDWIISPNKVRTRITHLNFYTGTDNKGVQLSNCTVETDRSTASKSLILDCPFEVGPGTYLGMGVQLDPTFEILIDDAANGIFTDPASPSKLSGTAPAGGADFVSVTATGGYTLHAPLATPFVVEEGKDFSINLVVDVVHSTQVVVAGGAPAFNTANQWVPINVYPTPNEPGRALVFNAFGTAENFNRGDPPWGPFFRVYFSQGQPTYLMLDGGGCSKGAGPAFAADPAQSVFGPGPNGTGKTGGYLGKDPDGNICWMFATDNEYTTYDSYFWMPDVATVGGTAALSCEITSTATPPTSGTTYASGCPSTAPSNLQTVTLVAD
jgi:hypothetical protein